MDRKNKKYSQLTLRHKRRRLIARAASNRSHHPEDAVQDLSSSESDSNRSSENEPSQVSSASENEPLNRENEQSSDEGSSSSESSHEEDSAEDVQDGDDIPMGNAEEESSDEENAVVHIHQDLAHLKKNALKNAFLTANITHKQGNLLLKTLREFPFNLNSLPKDTRTLLQTPTLPATRFIQELAGGEYLHIGFKNTITKKLQNLQENELPDHIEIDFSTDGAKLNNGADQFWLHQYRIYNISDKRPIIAGVFKGKHKPSNPFDFYEPFVQEMLEVRDQGGIYVGNRQLPLSVRCFIADAPARALVLNHYGHTSTNACSKCKVQGHRCTVPGFAGTMVFEGTRHPLRTDEEYRNITDEDHHKGRSPLAPILGLVTRVPLEIMHLVWLGNVKKVISAHIDGKFGYRRLSGRKLDIINARMVLLKSYCPSEFNRRPQEITMYHHFKATEYRQLLLYIAPAVFRNVLLDEYYDHFMILHCTMRILVVDGTPQEMFGFCQEALETYVMLCEELYGQQFLSYNVHALLHVVADAQELGGLDSSSAFCYENNMPEFRKYIRKPHLPLQQFYKRICELNDVNFEQMDHNIRIHVSQAHVEGPLSEGMPAHCEQFHKLKIGKTTFSTHLRDSCCALKNSKVCIIKNIVKVDEIIFLIVQEFRTASQVYDIGIPSTDVGVYHCTNLSNRVRAVNLDDVANKSYRMPKWSAVEGREENIVQNEWICVTLLTPFTIRAQN